MNKTRNFVLGTLVVVALVGCGEPNLETADFNAYFYFPDGREEHLGEVRGLSACQSAANARAASLDMLEADWSYICCRKTSNSECESKHR